MWRVGGHGDRMMKECSTSRDERLQESTQGPGNRGEKERSHTRDCGLS